MDFFLLSATSFNSFLFCDGFDDGVEPTVVHQLYTILLCIKTIGVYFFFVFGKLGRKVGCYTSVKFAVVEGAYDVDMTAFFA